MARDVQIRSEYDRILNRGNSHFRQVDTASALRCFASKGKFPLKKGRNFKRKQVRSLDSKYQARMRKIEILSKATSEYGSCRI